MEPQIPPVPPTPKINNSLIFIMSILLIVTVGIAGLFYFQIQKLSKQLTQVQVQATSTPTPTPNPTLDWKMYSNNLYAFQIKYPEKFSLTEDTNKKDFYDYLASLTYQNTNINIEAIYNIDVYQDSETRDVAVREVMDSGFKYNITSTAISGYAVAITVLETTPKSHTIATIAHPNKNLFIQISTEMDRTEFDQILSTFKFTEP